MDQRNLKQIPTETVVAGGAGTIHSTPILLKEANGLDFTIKPTDCSVTDCVVEVQRVNGGSFVPVIGGTDYADATNPRLEWGYNTTAIRKPNSLTTTQVGGASVRLGLSYAVRLAITVSGAGSVDVDQNTGNLV